MRQIINRKVYQTDRAGQIATYGSVGDTSDFYALAETPYKAPDGEYFLYCRGGAATKYGQNPSSGTGYGEELQVLTTEEALDWCEERRIDAEVIIEEFAERLRNVETPSNNTPDSKND